MTNKKGKLPPKKAKKSKKAPKPKTPSIPIREDDVKVAGKENRRGKISHTYPTHTSKGAPLRTPFAGGGMVTFRFSKKTYEANEKDAVRLLQFYKKHLSTWQVVKAWYAKGAIKNTPFNGGIFKDRKKRQGWAGRGKVVGYSTGLGPHTIHARMVNRQVRETQVSVRAAISGSKGEYGQNLAIIYKPAPFTLRGSPNEFEVNVFFTAKGMRFYRSQQVI